MIVPWDVGRVKMQNSAECWDGETRGRKLETRKLVGK
jgi:hypothetical protein